MKPKNSEQLKWQREVIRQEIEADKAEQRAREIAGRL